MSDVVITTEMANRRGDEDMLSKSKKFGGCFVAKSHPETENIIFDSEASLNAMFDKLYANDVVEIAATTVKLQLEIVMEEPSEMFERSPVIPSLVTAILLFG